MAADVISSILGLTLQGVGNNNNAWGTILNGSALQPLESAIAGVSSHAVTGGTLDLTTDAPPDGVTLALEMLQIFTGTLTEKQIVTMPNLSKTWYIFNNTDGDFPLHVQADGGDPVQIPQGTGKFVVCDGATNILRLDRDQVGNFEYNSVIKPGTLQCDGSSLLRADYPDLFSNVGTIFGSVDATHFTLPLLTDTNRFLRAADGTTLTVGTAQSNQNLAHTHTGATFSATTGTESADHTHTGSGSTGSESASHSHTGAVALAIQVNSTLGASVWQGSTTTGTESAAHTHAYSFTTSGRSAAHTHTVSGTTGTIPSAGGTEARPEALAVVISIRY